MEKINVIKRDGTKVEFDLGKWQAQIAKVCQGIAGVSPSMIEMAARPQFYDGMSTVELDKMALRAMIDLIDEEEHPDVGNVNYQFVAGRQRLAMLRKEVYGEYQPPRLYEIVKKNVEAGVYTDELLTWYSEAEWDAIDKWVDHDRDEDLPIAALEQLNDKYLIRNRVTEQRYETPQVRYAVAAATAFHSEPKDRLKWVREYYECASDGLFTLSTPVLAGLGTKTPQFSSCTVLRSDDTLPSIFATGQVMADYAAKRAGIGLEIGRLRPLGAPIRGGEVKHTGLIPFLKKWFYDLRSCSQGGIRNSSATVTCPIWHYQFDDFIQLKNNRGTDETRVRHLDYSVVVSKLFWRRLKQNGVITFFDPNEVPDLYEAYYRDIKEFERLYENYEKHPSLKKKVESAEKVFKEWIIKERVETGRIYILNIDNVQRQSSFDVTTHPIYSSNLCQEITLPTATFQTIDDPNGRIALCTLGSINWGAFKHPSDMRRAVRVLVRSLSNILGYQTFLSIQSKLSNQEFEPLGIGVTNLAYWHAKRNLKYGDADSLAEVKRWIEHQSFYAIETSNELAQDRGACGLSHTTCYGRGVFPWELRAEGVNDLTDFTPSDDLDWEGLRDKLKKYGIRNATLLALPPVESSSVCINSTNGIELVKQLIIVKESKGGVVTQVVPEYHKLKNRYEKLWDQPSCLPYLKTAAVLQAYVDQAISTNTFASARHYPDGKVSVHDIATQLMLMMHWGLKSAYYHLAEKEVIRDSKVEEVQVSNLVEEEDADCEACKL